MPTLYNRIQGRNLERLAALSDGIFAVAMTLLVLDLNIPTAAHVHSERELFAALGALAPQWIAYLMSFLTLGIFWAGQQTQLNHIGEGTIRHQKSATASVAASASRSRSTPLERLSASSTPGSVSPRSSLCS
jgi:uncharacterized membrane protein